MEGLLFKKQKLTEEKKNLLKQLENIEKDMKNNNYQIANQCKKDNNGHKMVNERDEGLYGERYTFCSECGIDYYGDYFHF
jgi:hypothetical protein